MVSHCKFLRKVYFTIIRYEYLGAATTLIRIPSAFHEVPARRSPHEGANNAASVAVSQPAHKRSSSRHILRGTRNRSDGAHQILYDGTNRSDSFAGEKCAINTCAVICIICVYLAINCV